MSGGQHHKGLAWVTAGGLAVAVIAAIGGIAMPPGETLWHLIAAPEEDGGWDFVRIDGIDVTDENYSIGIRWSEIVGYHDGCNSCGVSGESEGIYHMRTCTLQACAEQPNERLFRLFLASNVRMLPAGDRLFLTVPGHRAELVRNSHD
ncbi:hypothetical protein [Qipengyuania sphaerica]|uniref:hypothetical protein n=1 Tax=Qipengyuania sphaerica TaxID=2867243 RepID=UPI001C87D937|nr:hypothetical protein [Qipengyuania sphaerica]MBX7539644.1 hypothetical protein [Qipengyuania sphaerica]